MSRKQLEIQLSQLIDTFQEPKIELEQYQTPPRVAANLLHIAWTRHHIENCRVVDLCAGTGILGLGAALLGATVTLVEMEKVASKQLHGNAAKIDRNVTVVEGDVLAWETDNHFDTAILNPPFGIQQSKVSDLAFVKKASTLADHIYSIHDGSPTNQERLPTLYEDLDLDIVEAYIDEFPISRTYPWHKKNSKNDYQVLIIHSMSS